MKKLAFLLVMSVGILSLSANDPLSDEPAAIKTSQIQGNIVDSKTGEALAGVALRVNGSDKKVYSDLEGRFSIHPVTQGTYEIEVNYVSYKPITLKEITATSKDINLKVELESVSRK